MFGDHKHRAVYATDHGLCNRTENEMTPTRQPVRGDYDQVSPFRARQPIDLLGSITVSDCRARFDPGGNTMCRKRKLLLGIYQQRLGVGFRT